MTAETEVDDFDPEARELCPDGSCTGVLGPDRRCRVCGLAADGDRPAAAEAEAPLTATAVAAPPDDDAFDDRALCPDGACLGVLGPDGRCPECGRQGSPIRTGA